MKIVARRIVVGLGLALVLCLLIGATYLASQRRAPALSPGAVFCDSASNLEAKATYRLVIYLDLNACLTCNEDMDAWRELCGELRARGGAISVFSKRCDSADVAWAMHLEQISDTTRVLDKATLDVLGWRELGTPVKVQLDGQCRQVKIAGFMGNRALSRQFIDQIKETICGISPALSVAAPR
ncbi:MAG TPA: hypothetical protein VMS71_04145 [Candidatus Acidoferrum sp.]|nr:hypothetical protein [Candidatus Acidoferrum sp.]